MYNFNSYCSKCHPWSLIKETDMLNGGLHWSTLVVSLSQTINKCSSLCFMCLYSENNGEWASPGAPEWVASPSHLTSRPGSNVGAANAAGGQTPRNVVQSQSASQQTLQRGRTVVITCLVHFWPVLDHLMNGLINKYVIKLPVEGSSEETRSAGWARS